MHERWNYSKTVAGAPYKAIENKTPCLILNMQLLKLIMVFLLSVCCLRTVRLTYPFVSLSKSFDFLPNLPLTFLEKIQKLAVIFPRNKIEYYCQPIEVFLHVHGTQAFAGEIAVKMAGKTKKSMAYFKTFFTSRCRRRCRRSRQRRMSNITDTSAYV